MGQYGVIGHSGGALEIDDIGVMKIVQITTFNRHDRLIESKPVLHPIAKETEAGVSIFCIGVNHIATFPPPLFLHHRRHIKVEQIDKRGYPLRQQLVNHPIVEIHRLWIDFTPPLGHQARPGN